MRKAIGVNAKGIREIQKFLEENHKLGGEHFTTEMLDAWALQAEFQQGEGNPAEVEIKACDSICGWTVKYRLSDEGQDWAEVYEVQQGGQLGYLTKLVLGPRRGGLTNLPRWTHPPTQTST